MLSSRDADRARRWRSNRIELAAEFGVSTTTISNITKGNTYAA